MNFSKLTLAIATTLAASASFNALAMDLYVDTKTKQIYAEPGRGRVLMGAFERVEDKMAAPADTSEIADVRQDLEAKTNEIKALQEHVAEVEQVKVKIDTKGLQVESADKNFSARIGGRIQADANYSSNDNYFLANPQTGRITTPRTNAEANDGTEIRRARIDFLGTFYKDWNFKTQLEFADAVFGVRDLYLEYTGLDFLNVTVGQQKQNFSRELQESSNDQIFNERSLMNVLNAPVVDRAIGLNLQTKAKTGYYAALGVYGDSILPARNGGEIANAGDEGWSVSGRATYAPIEEKTKVVHLGIAGNYRVPDANGDVATSRALRYDYETNHQSNLNLIDTTVNEVESITQLGLEASGLYGPFSVGAEYTHVWLDRKRRGAATFVGGTNDLELDGWYAEGAWTITGESRKYKQGRFYKLDPAKKFSVKNGGWGAWELATRYSSVDLNDGIFKGGKISNIAVALNWYLNNNVRLQADYTRVFDISNAAVQTANGGDPDNNNTFNVRAQLAW